MTSQEKLDELREVVQKLLKWSGMGWNCIEEQLGYDMEALMCDDSLDT